MQKQNIENNYSKSINFEKDSTTLKLLYWNS